MRAPSLNTRGNVCLFKTVECPKPVSFSVNGYVRSPFAVVLPFVDAFCARRIMRRGGTVAHIHRVRGNPKVLNPIVELVSIDVVDKPIRVVSVVKFPNNSMGQPKPSIGIDHPVIRSLSDHVGASSGLSTCSRYTVCESAGRSIVRKQGLQSLKRWQGRWRFGHSRKTTISSNLDQQKISLRHPCISAN